MSKKIFVSVPMNGEKDEDIWNRLEFLGIVAGDVFFPGEECVIIDNFGKEMLSNKDVKQPGLFFIGVGLQRMSAADVVVFAEDFLQSRGCRFEAIACQLYGIPAYSYDPYGRFSDDFMNSETEYEKFEHVKGTPKLVKEKE